MDRDLSKTAQYFRKAGLTLILGKDQEKQKKKDKYLRLLAIAFLVLLIAFFAWKIVDNELRIKSLERTYMDNEMRIEQLIKEKNDLLNQLEYIESDNYVKEMARSKLDMLRPGEIMFVRK